MATNKRELAKEIEAVLRQSGNVTNKEEAAKALSSFAAALADKIDAYVQYQVGLRLEGILNAVATPSTGANQIPLVRGPGFDALTRKK